MVHRADDDLTAGVALDLGMTFQAKIAVALDEHLGVDRPVRCVARDAAFAQCVVLVNVRQRLFAMTFGAGFVQARHGESGARRLHDVRAVRVVALRAIHLPFQHRVALRQPQFGVNLQMARQARLRIVSGIDDELTFTATGCDVSAARAVAGFASGLAGHVCAVDVDAGVRARGEPARDISVTFETRLVPDETGAFDHGNFNDTALDGGTGRDDHGDHAAKSGKRDAQEPSTAGVHALDLSHGPDLSFASEEHWTDRQPGTGTSLANDFGRFKTFSASHGETRGFWDF